MPSQTIRMADDPQRFRLRRGDRVAWKMADGQADVENSGVVIDGVWEGDPARGSYRVIYQVQRHDRQYFNAGELQLVCLITDATLREQIRERFRSGLLPQTLPAAPIGELQGRETMRVNAGRGKPCSACDQIISPLEMGSIEFEYASGQVVRFHAVCHEVWDEERRSPRPRS